jgi:hypothetical protein
MATTVDMRLVAVGEGSSNSQGNSLVYLYDCEKKKLINKLTFH